MIDFFLSKNVKFYRKTFPLGELPLCWGDFTKSSHSLSPPSHWYYIDISLSSLKGFCLWICPFQCLKHIRGALGWFGGVWTLFGNQPPHPPTFGRNLPTKTFFWGVWGSPYKKYLILPECDGTRIFSGTCTYFRYQICLLLFRYQILLIHFFGTKISVPPQKWIYRWA